MALAPFSGTIPSKKKAELQEIANALGINDSGTRDELRGRIERHLEKHQSRYSGDPTFAGLYGKRKALGRFAAPADSPQSVDIHSSHHIIAALAREATPISDMHDVSVMLRNLPASPQVDSPNPLDKLSPITADYGRLIQSTPRTDLRTVSKSITSTAVESLTTLQVNAQQRSRITLLTTRAILSDSTNIWLLTALAELLYIIYTVIPWETAQLATSLTGSRGQFHLDIPYPPVHTFLQPAFWTVLLHWSIPSIFVPIVFGVLISFHPVNSTSVRTPRVLVLDPLSASIARLAMHVVYPFQTLDTTFQGIDVIGRRWRLLTASVVVAFAFAEAVFSAPSAYAESRARLRAGTPRRTIASEDTLVSVNGES